MNMNKNNENKLIPRLRFPEFQQSGEWEVKKLGEVFDFQEGFPFSSRDLTDNKENAKQVVRITEINNHNKNAEKVYVPNNKIEESSIEYYKVTKGDLLLSLTGAAGFNFFIWNGEEAYLNQRNVKFIPKDKINKAILFLIEPLIHKKINLMGTGQNNNLSKEALKDVLLLIPKLPEQQKIASCLSSLDEVIAGERQKLALLQQHKKGLLQQLFPQEGETVPKLRFKEFEDSGEWEVKRLEEILDYERPDKYIVRDENYTNEGTPVLTANKSFILGYTQETDGICNDIPAIIFDDFTVDKKFVDFPFKVKSSAIKILRAKGKDDLKFLFELMSLIRFEAKEHKRYYISTYQKLSVPIPKPAEQQKIASCLSSLDDVINAQTQKIELLEQHKKGLLQGLFPNVNDNE
jgi:type I restriction enzyme S subunit